MAGQEQPVSRRQRLARTRVYRALLRRLTPDLLAVRGVPQSANRFVNIPLPADVVVYFPDDATKIYQLQQWLPQLEQLHQRHNVLVVTRNLGTFRGLQDLTGLPLIYARRLRDLNHVLESTHARACLYVNNSATNFQMLGWSRALHVHLNHGESDKISMATNQAKAYDYVLVAGPAAVHRYENNLLALDTSKLVEVGRPQLDLQYDRVLPASTRTTVLYAPTWEGETPAMDYNSLTGYGEGLARALLRHGGYRVVYKPHPKILTGTPAIVRAHQTVCRLLHDDNALRSPEDRHLVELDRPILSLFEGSDILVSDVSSVALDWLFLRTHAPLWIADPRNDRSALVQASPLASWTYVLDAGNLPRVAEDLHRSLVEDERAAARQEGRRYYFGELQPGESTERFLKTVDMALERCSQLLAERRREHHDFEMAAGVS